MTEGAVLYLVAANDLEAADVAARAMRLRRPVPSCWTVIPLDPPPPRRRRLFNWWAPRMRLYQVNVEPQEMLRRMGKR